MEQLSEYMRAYGFSVLRVCVTELQVAPEILEALDESSMCNYSLIYNTCQSCVIMFNILYSLFTRC